MFLGTDSRSRKVSANVESGERQSPTPHVPRAWRFGTMSFPRKRTSVTRSRFADAKRQNGARRARPRSLQARAPELPSMAVGKVLTPGPGCEGHLAHFARRKRHGSSARQRALAFGAFRSWPGRPGGTEHILLWEGQSPTIFVLMNTRHSRVDVKRRHTGTARFWQRCYRIARVGPPPQHPYHL